jgi:hypothetical protein
LGKEGGMTGKTERKRRDSGKSERSYHTKFAAFEIMENNMCMRRIYKRFFHGKGKYWHSPVPFGDYSLNAGRDKLHPVTGINHHSFF